MHHMPLAARPTPGNGGGTRCEPSRRLTAGAFQYTPSFDTDLRARFGAMRAEQEQAKAKAKAAAAKAARHAPKTAQQRLPLDALVGLEGVPRFLLSNQWGQ